MPSFDKLSVSAIKNYFQGPLTKLRQDFNFKQIKAMARSLGVNVTGRSIAAIQEEVQLFLNGSVVSQNAASSQMSTMNSNSEDTNGASSSSGNHSDNHNQQQQRQQDEDDEGDDFDDMPNTYEQLNRTLRTGSRGQFDEESMDSVKYQQYVLMQFINERKAEKLADEWGFATVMQNRKWTGMEKKDCEAIKDLAMMILRIKVAIGDTDEFLEGLFDKALKVAKQRLLEHMVGEVSWQAAAFIGESDNPLQKAMNEILKSFNGYRREYKVRKPEPAVSDNSDNAGVNQNRQAKQLVTCFNCKEVGHISRNCPRKVGALNNGVNGNISNNSGNDNNGNQGSSFSYGSHP